MCLGKCAREGWAGQDCWMVKELKVENEWKECDEEKGSDNPTGCADCKVSQKCDGPDHCCSFHPDNLDRAKANKDLPEGCSASTTCRLHEKCEARPLDIGMRDDSHTRMDRAKEHHEGKERSYTRSDVYNPYEDRWGSRHPLNYGIFSLTKTHPEGWYDADHFEKYNGRTP